MKIFVAGGSGVIGRRLVRLLVGRGHRVAAMTRSKSRAQAIYRCGAEPVVCNIFRGAELAQAMLDFAPELVVNQLSNIPRRLNPRRIEQEMAPTNRVRTEGLANLIQAAKAAGVEAFVSQSVAGLYEPGRDDAALEDDPLYLDAPADFAGMVAAIHASEQQTQIGGFSRHVILRYGWFYGPDTMYAPDGSFAYDVVRWRVPLIGEGQGQYSFVHVDDAAEATAVAIESHCNGAFNIVDDLPVAANEWLPEYARMLGARRPLRLPEMLGRIAGGPFAVFLMTRQRGASNHAIGKELGWRPRFPNWRTGMRQVFDAALAAAS